MEPYDQTKRYFGPQGSWLCKLIPEFPAGIPQAQPIFNRGGYTHDRGYEGNKTGGFWGWLRDAMDRRKVDRQLLTDLLVGIAHAEDQGILSESEADRCDDYAHLAYDAIRAGGWMFFRKKEEKED